MSVPKLASTRQLKGILIQSTNKGIIKQLSQLKNHFMKTVLEKNKAKFIHKAELPTKR
jgi:hypothetical protein